MKKATNFIIIAIAAIMALGLTSCAKGTQRTQIIKAVDEMKAQLPYYINSVMSITDVNLDTDNWIIEYEFTVTDAVVSTASDANDEATAAQMVNALTGDSKMRKAIDEAEVGFKLTLKGETITKTLDFPYEKIKELREKLDNGEVETLSFIERTRRELASTQFPIDLGDGVKMTNMEVGDNSITYVYTVDTMDGIIDDSDVLDQMKNIQVSELQPMVGGYKDEIIAENINFIYNYYTANGELGISITITPSDLF